jgi:hypothetical protein
LNQFDWAVEPGSPGWFADLRSGDIVTSVNRQAACHETMASLNQTLHADASACRTVPSPISVQDSTLDRAPSVSGYAAPEHDIHLNLSGQNAFQGQAIELVFKRSSGLTVAFKGQQNEEWVHTSVGKASLQVKARQGRETV